MVTPTKSKRKEKAPSHEKSKRKTVESSAVGPPKKKLWASTMWVAERADVWSSHNSFRLLGESLLVSDVMCFGPLTNFFR